MLSHLIWNPTHSDRDAGDADQEHLDTEVAVFVRFDEVHVHVDFLSDDDVQSDLYASFTTFRFAA